MGRELDMCPLKGVGVWGDVMYEEWNSDDLMRHIFEGAGVLQNEKYERAMRAFEGVRGGDSQALKMVLQQGQTI